MLSGRHQSLCCLQSFRGILLLLLSHRGRETSPVSEAPPLQYFIQYPVRLSARHPCLQPSHPTQSHLDAI